MLLYSKQWGNWVINWKIQSQKLINTGALSLALWLWLFKWPERSSNLWPNEIQSFSIKISNPLIVRKNGSSNIWTRQQSMGVLSHPSAQWMRTFCWLICKISEAFKAKSRNFLIVLYQPLWSSLLKNLDSLSFNGFWQNFIKVLYEEFIYVIPSIHPKRDFHFS